MIILSGSDIEMAFGADVLFSGVSFEVDEKDRIGLVGVNGTGKTTLFKIINRITEPESGTINKTADTRIGYMEQHVVRDSGVSVYDEALSVSQSLIDLEKQLEEIHAEIDGGNHSEEILDRQMKLQERFERDGGLEYRARTKSALTGLGFTAEEQEKPVSVLSGGQKSKVQLAKLLLSGANLLLLDEPTNHLDIKACEWLEKFLLEYRGAYIVISHDRYFLDKVTAKTFELENKHLTVWKGNYTGYRRLKEEKRLTMQREYDNTMAEIKRIEGIIEQQKRFNQERNYVTIAHKQHSIDRLRETLVKPEAAPEELHFTFPCFEGSGNDVLYANNLCKSFDGEVLFRNVCLDIKKGERVFLLGPNGCGKSTLFKILVDKCKADFGDFRLGARIKIGYFDQIQTGLTDTKTVMDEIWDEYPKMTQTQVRTALGSFLFKGEEVFKKIGSLSGGEKARVALLKLMLSGCNFLLLDEPTNHLDIGAREALEQALLGYKGTLFVISHDRYLINKLAGTIYTLTENGAEKFDGNYDDYVQSLESVSIKAQPERSEEKPKVNNYRLQKERESELRKLNTRVKKAEERISQLEGQLEELNKLLMSPEIACDFEKATEITKQIEECNAELETQMEEWEAAGALLETRTASGGNTGLRPDYN